MPMLKIEEIEELIAEENDELSEEELVYKEKERDTKKLRKFKSYEED